MSPKKQTRRGGTRGRGRGVAKRRGPKSHSLMSPSTATADDTDADGTSTDGNGSFKRRLSQSPSPTRKKQTDYIEERELSLPRLKPTTIPENSTFLSLLSHGENSNYVMTDDELDHVQWDLESMLTSVIVRKNTIRDELNTFAAMQFARSLHRVAKNPKLPTIRPRAAAEISPVNECRKMKVDFDPTSKELPPNKTESANKFWSLVEPYLAHIKKEDLNWLEDLVKSYSSDKKLYEIPSLGEHYAKNWAKEELEMQKTQSSCSPRPVRKLKLAERISPDVVELVNKVNSATHDGSVFTPIYQRVVASLLEHSHNMSVEDLEENFSEYDDDEKPVEMSNICKEFYAEQNVKKQLHKLGLMGRHAKPVPVEPLIELPSTFIKSDDDHDEILEELMKCNSALAQIREMNKNHLTNLLGRVRKDYCQQIIKNKIENINNEILNFKRQQNESWTKEKIMAQTSEEDEELNFLLNQRGNYIMQLQSVEFEASSCLSPSVSEDSESSDEEYDNPSKIHDESSEHDTSVQDNAVLDTGVKQEVKLDDEFQIEENFEQIVKIIKQEIDDEKMDCDEFNVNDKNIEYHEQAINGNVDTEEIEKTNNVKNETDNTVENENNQTNIQMKEKESVGCSGIVKPSIKRRRRKTNLGTSENEQTSKIESKKPIKIKQDTNDYESELDPSEDTIDGIQRELRPRKLSEKAYFEQDDGVTSDESDFTDLSN